MPVVLADFFTIVYPSLFLRIGPTFMLAKSRIIKFVASLGSAILLSQCAKALEPQAQVQPAATKEEPRLAQEAPYTLPATTYLALAKSKTEEEKQKLLLMAAGRFIYEGQWRDGREILARINELSPIEAKEKA